jgi:hypothetical protein
MGAVYTGPGFQSRIYIGPGVEGRIIVSGAGAAPPPRPAYQPLEFGQFTVGVRNGFNPVAVIVKNTGNELWSLQPPAPGADTSNPFTQGWTLDTLINPDFGYGYTESDGSGTPSFQIPGKNAVNLSDAADLGGHVRDAIIAGPGGAHPWNSQKTGLDREGGLVIVNAGIWLATGFEWAPSKNYVAARGGIGQNAEANLGGTGKGWMTQSNRCLKVQDCIGGHLEGYKATGVIYEFFNEFSTSKVGPLGTQMQRGYVGTITAKLIDRFGKVPGDSGYISGAHDGGDYKQRQNSGGVDRDADITVLSDFQAEFRDNVSGQGATKVFPTERTSRRVEVIGTSANNSLFFFRESGTDPIPPTELTEVFYEGPNTHYDGAAGVQSTVLYMSGKAVASSVVSGGTYDGRTILKLEASANVAGGVMIGRRTPGQYIADPSRTGGLYDPTWAGWATGAADVGPSFTPSFVESGA